MIQLVKPVTKFRHNTAYQNTILHREKPWQPRPYPAQCRHCGGTTFLYVRISGKAGTMWADFVYDAVQFCECRRGVQVQAERSVGLELVQ